MNFILAVKNLERTEFEYSITKIPQVIQRLQPYEFRQKSIYNYALLEKLLSTEDELEKRDLLSSLRMKMNAVGHSLMDL